MLQQEVGSGDLALVDGVDPISHPDLGKFAFGFPPFSSEALQNSRQPLPAE